MVVTALQLNLDPSDARRRDTSVHVESLDHIHIYAANPEESAEFYQQHFEAKQVHRNVNANGDVRRDL